MNNEQINFLSVTSYAEAPLNYFIVNGVFIHGEAEQKFQTDLCVSSINLLEMEEGIYEVKLNNEDGYLLYLWKIISNSEFSINRGLICSKEDIEACYTAKEYFNQKKRDI